MNHMKIGIKLIIALVIMALAIVGTRKESKVPGSSGALAVAAGVLAIVNVAIAVLVLPSPGRLQQTPFDFACRRAFFSVVLRSARTGGPSGRRSRLTPR